MKANIYRNFHRRNKRGTVSPRCFKLPAIDLDGIPSSKYRRDAATRTTTTLCSVLVLVLVPVIIAVVHKYEASIGVCRNNQ